MKSYYYNIFGFVIKSEFKLDQAVEEDSGIEPDIYIKEAKMPEWITGKIEKENIVCEYKENDYWFYLKDIGVYRLYKKKYMYVQPDENAQFEHVQCLILGGALDLLMFQRGIISMHGAAININEEAVFLTGHSGAGKSSLMTEFLLNGFKYISDDIGAIRIIDDKVNIMPAYPQQKLCRDAALNFGYDLNKLRYINKERDKFAISSRKYFYNKKLPLKAIYEIKEHNGGDIRLEEVKGADKLKAIINSIYERDICKYIGIKDSCFNTLLKTAQQASYYIIYRPKEKFTVKDQMNIILKNIV